MGLDFWATKLKKGLKEKDFNCINKWDLIDDDDIDEILDIETREFMEKKDDKSLYRFCKETVDFFIGGEAVYSKSAEDIDELVNRLNNFIKENPKYIYKEDNNIVYSNEEIRLFIKYINIARDNGFVIWCSW